MSALRKTFAVAALSLVLSACGGDPVKPLFDALKSGDYAKTESLSDALIAKKPDSKAVHAVRFALFRHLSVHGPADKQAAYVTKSIAEYDALAQSLGLKPDYANMEDSLRSNPEGKALLQAARGPLYGE